MLRPALISLLFGGLIGLIEPGQLYSVEIAQVVAGVVHLPPHAPMALHDGRAFSLIIDAGALLLHAGLSTDAVCRLLSIAMGTVSSLAVTAVAYAFTSNSLIAAAAPLLIVSGLITPGVPLHKYDYTFPLGSSDLGVNGMTFALLAVAVVAIRPAAGVWLLPVSMAVHPSLGLAAMVIVATGGAFDRAFATSLLRHWKGFTASALMMAVLWSGHQLLAAPSPAPPPVDISLIEAIIKWWDPHRSPVLAPGAGAVEWFWLFAYDAAFLILAITALVMRPPLLERVRFWLWGLVVVTVVVCLVTLADEFRPMWGPLPLHSLMLSRWLNFNVIVAPFLVVALAIHVAGGLVFIRLPERIATAVVICGMAAVFAYKFTYTATYRDYWEPDAAFSERVGRRPGLFIVGAEPGTFVSVQLRTRRAPLFDWDLIDTVPYAPAMSRGVEDILKTVYGVSLLDSSNWEQFGDLRGRWEPRTAAEWRAILQPLGVTDIIVPSAWSLQLPRVDASDDFALYTIAP